VAMCTSIEAGGVGFRLQITCDPSSFSESLSNLGWLPTRVTADATQQESHAHRKQAGRTIDYWAAVAPGCQGSRSRAGKGKARLLRRINPLQETPQYSMMPGDLSDNCRLVWLSNLSDSCGSSISSGSQQGWCFARLSTDP
jgi:hypothetical protein